MTIDLSLMIANQADHDWLDETACADMDVPSFFVEAGHTIRPEVLNVCRGCPVRQDCLEHAYDQGIAGGYFGGMSPGQRRDIDFEAALVFIKNDPVKKISSRRRRSS